MKTSNKVCHLCLALLITGIILDISALASGGSLTSGAAWFWLAGFALTFGLTLCWLLRTTAGWLREGATAPLFALGVVAWVCFSHLAGWERTPVNGESAMQLATGLRNWTRPGLGYLESGFFGAYPARQYLLVSLPSLWAGPGYVTLRLGYALFFFIGWWTFLAGLDLFWKRNSSPATSPAWAGLAALSVVACPIVAQFIRMFEQTLLPVATTLLFLGWALRTWRDANPWWSLPLAWSGGFLGGNYTPALATWCLALAALGLMVFHRRPPVSWPRPLIAGVFMSVAASGLAVQLAVREELAQRLTFQRFGDSVPMPWGERLARVGEGLGLAFENAERPFLAPILVFPVLVVLLAGLFGLVKPRWLFLSALLWAGLGIALAVTLRGLFHRSVEFDLHRAMVVLPPSLLGVAAVWRAWWEEVPSPLRRLPLLFVFVLGLHILVNLPKARDIGTGLPHRPGLGDILTGEVVSLTLRLSGPPGSTPVELIISAEPGFPRGLENYLGYFCPHPETRTWYEPQDLAALVGRGKAFADFHPPGRPLPDRLATAGVKVLRGEGWDPEGKRMVPYEGWVYEGPAH